VRAPALAHAHFDSAVPGLPNARVLICHYLLWFDPLGAVLPLISGRCGLIESCPADGTRIANSPLAVEPAAS
jgi:hypothetical protein